jgi:hypothetical protein
MTQPFKTAPSPVPKAPKRLFRTNDKVRVPGNGRILYVAIDENVTEEFVVVRDTINERSWRYPPDQLRRV